MTVTEGTLVSLEYTLKDESQNVIESNIDSEPLVYVHGGGQMIPGLEKALEGMEAGESKEVVVPPEEGYGGLDQEAFVEVPLDKVRERRPAFRIKRRVRLPALQLTQEQLRIA